MYYSAIVLLAVMILLIENYDLLLKRGDHTKKPAWKVYRKFLLAILVYYVFDALWGFIEYRKHADLLFIDTQCYYVAMASGILLWTQFIVSYLNAHGKFSRLLLWFGRGFFAAYTLAVAVNIFTPFLFTVDDRCVYHATTIRHIFLIIQVMLLLVTAVYSFVKAAHANPAQRSRFHAIAFFGVIMAVFLTVQIWFPYLPLYAVAYLLGTCLLHTFVINNEREEYKSELEKALERETHQYEELVSTRMLAYKDTLTGVKSKLAYVEYEAEKNLAIREGRKPKFSIAVFDVNGLKKINDTLGHKQGDQFIMDACKMICTQFNHSPVFRIGGDEFVAMLEREDYDNRQDLIQRFDSMMNTPQRAGQPVIAMGVSDYQDGADDSLHDVFVRADRLMYERKRELKCMEQ